MTAPIWRWHAPIWGPKGFSSSRRRTWTFWKASTPKPTLAKNVLRATLAVSLPMSGSWQRCPPAARLDRSRAADGALGGDPRAQEDDYRDPVVNSPDQPPTVPA